MGATGKLGYPSRQKFLFDLDFDLVALRRLSLIAIAGREL